jgi:hypothetical protein
MAVCNSLVDRQDGRFRPLGGILATFAAPRRRGARCSWTIASMRAETWHGLRVESTAAPSIVWRPLVCGRQRVDATSGLARRRVSGLSIELSWGIVCRREGSAGRRRAYVERAVRRVCGSAPPTTLM